MCRSIKVLRGADPPATPEDIHAAALQFIRKVSGFRKPSRANEADFDQAVDEVADAAARLLTAIEARGVPAKPLADARGSVPSHDRKGVVPRQ